MYCSCKFKKWDRELGREGGEEREGERVGGMRGKERQAVCFRHFAIPPVFGAALLGLVEGQTIRSRVQGHQPFPLPLYSPEGEALWHHMFL